MIRGERAVYAIFGLGLVAMSPVVVRWSLPNSHWFAVRTITVGDAAVGEPIPVVVDRTIARPFRARWIATVRRVTRDGLENACVGLGENDYRPTAVLPRGLTLDAYLNRTCALPAGQYRLTVLWTIDDWPEDREVRADSNVFRVE